jgi:nucleoside-diphosphate-sugar epimerase
MLQDLRRGRRLEHDALNGAVVRAAVRAGVSRFVFASTIKVHGEATAPGRPFRGDDPFAPHDGYARSKVDAERALAVIAAESPLETIVLRLPLVYGPRVKGNFATLLDAVAREALLPFGRVANRRDFLYVGNLVHGIAALVDAPDPVRGAWLMSDGEAVATPELVRRLAAAGLAAAAPPPPATWRRVCFDRFTPKL